VRAADGLAGRLDDRSGVAFVKVIRSGARDAEGNLPPEVWREEEVNPTLNGFDVGDARAVTLVAPTMNSNKTGGWRLDPDQAESLVLAGQTADDPLLPPGLDSNRYRCAGNGVVSSVAEWIGWRLAAYFGGRPG
jgi:hypothetical protein